ncbi:GAF domain-containing protein [Dactylosporangium sp. NPDC051541]|uniref:GAF domain-containing protein n=1 Tax=Dactylosporangium sp. NPDC051541 TaxID=3363977 RepID=UPI00378BE7F4
MTELRRMQQDLIDAEVRTSRRDLLTVFHDRLSAEPQTLVADDFMVLADRPTVRSAIIVAAAGVADACALYARDPGTRVLRIARHRGLPAEYVDAFATVDATCPSVCGAALAGGAPVVVDDVTTSPIFAGQPTLDVTLAAGFRAAQAYPLRDGDRRVLGLLSLLYRTAGRRGRTASRRRRPPR